MPILDLDISDTSRYEASRFLGSPELISACPAESVKADDPELLSCRRFPKSQKHKA
jgi:hypothetical protein